MRRSSESNHRSTLLHLGRRIARWEDDCQENLYFLRVTAHATICVFICLQIIKKERDRKKVRAIESNEDLKM